MIKKLFNFAALLLCFAGLFGCDNGPEPDDNIKRGTFNRPYPKYYEEGVPLLGDDSYVVYLNFDGFAKRYIEEFITEASKTYTPTISKIMNEGVTFDNLRTTMPSITGPCQIMILSGTTSAITHNAYKYYDPNENTVIQQARESDALLLPQAVVDAGITTASVRMYLAEGIYSETQHDMHNYIDNDNTLPSVMARGADKYGDHFARFEQLIKLVKGEPMKTRGTTITIPELPRFIMFYGDDVDAIAHNETAKRGYARATSEAERKANIMHLIADIDAKLGEFIEVCKERGIYDKMTFFMTTDHGMVHFGTQGVGDTQDTANSKIFSLFSAIRRFDPNIAIEYIPVDGTPKPTTNVVAYGSNLNVQLYFKRGITDERLEELKTALEKEDYVYQVMTRKELDEAGFWTKYTHMIISPKDRYCFAPNVANVYSVRGQHDSLQDDASHIIGYIWGKGIKKDYHYTDRAFNYDFGVTMAASMGLVLPQANGIVLDVFERED